MITTNTVFSDMINSPIRHLAGRVELYEGSTLALMCGCHDRLKNFTIERIGEEGKFFGFGVCQKINVHLIDKDREVFPQAGMIVEAVFGVEEDYMYPFPKFYITETHRDEKTNELSITAYDSLYAAASFSYAELDLKAPYTIEILAAAVASFLGLPLNLEEADPEAFAVNYPGGGSFGGTETLREVLNAIAEATQTIFYINHNWELTFKQLDRDGAALMTIDKEKYFTLDSGANRRLRRITSTTELGDNVTSQTSLTGTTQYIRDNPLLEGRDDIATILDRGIVNLGNMTINTFDCDWRGNFLLEIGDKFNLTTKDNGTVHSYLLNDTLTFDGTLSQHTAWNFTDNSMETAANPTSLGDALNHTFARVDKAERKIDLVASNVDQYGSDISQLEIKTDGITATVASNRAYTDASLGVLEEEVRTLTNQVQTSMTTEQVKILVQEVLNDGVNSITTTTGFTFDDVGLTIDKSDSEMSTTITEDGMTVYKNNQEMLVANNEGVQAQDLHATTFLIVGKNSRFEDYDNGTRTGCFWIGYQTEEEV